MSEIFKYVKSFFSFVPSTNDNYRKRKRSSFPEFQVPTKIRKTVSDFEDKWQPLLQFQTAKRQPTMNFRNTPHSINKCKESLIYSDEDDDVLEIKPRYSSKFVSSLKTSTPNTNGDDDVVMINCGKSLSKKKEFYERNGLDYMTSFSLINEAAKRPEKPLFRDKNDLEKNPSVAKSNLNNQNHCNNIRSSTLNNSYRLDEKFKYSELISKAAPSFSSGMVNGSSPTYHTPRGSMFVDSNSRAGKMFKLLPKSKPSIYIDLTEEKITHRPKISTKDRIQKVLSDYDNDTVTIKDSDSEIEVLPTPPSPKPDIKVDKVNSFKKVVDTNQTSRKEWLEEILGKYCNSLNNNQKEIQKQEDQRSKFSVINNEIQTKLLQERIKRSLCIKDIVIPDELPEEDSLPILTEENEKLISRALNVRGNPNEVLAQKFNLSITRRDLMTLSGLNWLNDEVINFYMNLIIQRGKLSQWPKSYAMNTFFYPKLLKDGASSLKRWTKKVDIFAHDIIAVPIHLGVHWCMSIIDFRTKTIKYYDSMGGSNSRCLEALLSYLQAEHLDKKKTQYDVSNWKLKNVKDIPQQMNGSDCGMFSCSFAEFLTRDSKITFTQDDMPYLRRKMALEIITGNLIVT